MNTEKPVEVGAKKPCPECGEPILSAGTHWPGYCHIYCPTGRARVGLEALLPLPRRSLTPDESAALAAESETR